MLHSLRVFSKTWIAKILLTVLVISFAAFGINNVITDLGGNTIARVGDEEITTRQFQRAYNSELNRFAQQIGSLPTTEQAIAVGIPSSALQRLSSEAAISSLGKQLGLGVSDAKLAELLRADPSFAGTLGAFEPAAFRQVLLQSGITESEYFDDQSKRARRDQLARGLFGDVVTPKAAEQIINRYTTDKRAVDYFVLTDTSIPSIPEPTDADLAAYLTENQANFRTVETRTADVLALTVPALAATKTITDDQVAAEYEATKANRVKIESRDIVSVNLPNDITTKWFETGKASGKTFDALIAEAGLTPTDIGDLTKAQVTDAALAEAAFSLAAVGDFAIIDGAQGKRAVSITSITPGGEIPLAEASDAIRAELATRAAKDEYVDILDQIEELRAAFKPLSEIATRYGLTVHTVPVTATGAELASISDIAEADRARVAQAIFAAQPEKLVPTVSINANNNVWVDLKSTEAARDQTLDEVRDSVVAAWTLKKTDEALAAEVEKITAQLESGTPLADIAASLSLFPQLSQPFGRQGDGTSVLNSAVATEAFAGGPDHFGSAINGDGDHVIFQVVDVTHQDEAIDPNLSTYVTESTRDGLFGEFVGGVMNDLGVRENQAAISQFLIANGASQ